MAFLRGLLVLILVALVGAASVVATEAAQVQALGTADPSHVTELLDGPDGPIASRIRAEGGAWQLPVGDAVLIDEEWWSPLRPLDEIEVAPIEPTPETLVLIRSRVAPAATRRRPDRLTAYSVGDVDQDGEDDLVLSFRRPFERNYINITRPRKFWADDYGLSAHLGLYRPHDLSEIWVAGTLVSPVAAVSACNGGLAVAYGELGTTRITETGAWRWIVFGFLPVEPLPGHGIPTCVDIDGDGLTEPAITGRSDP